MVGGGVEGGECEGGGEGEGVNVRGVAFDIVYVCTVDIQPAEKH